MTTQQIVNLLTRYGFIIIAVAVTVIGWVSRYVKAQKREQTEKRAKERRELESLRTGRYEASPERVSAPAPSAQASLEEIAARRRAKIEEVQRRRTPASPSVSSPHTQMSTGQGSSQELGRALGQILGIPSQPAPSSQPAGQQPVQPARRPVSGPAGRPSTRPQPQQRPVPVQRPRTSAPRPQPAPPAPRPAPSQRSASQRRVPDDSSDHASAQKMSQAKLAPQHDQNAPTYSYATGDAGKNQASRDAASGRWKRQSTVGGLNLRRLFLMREVFEKPVSMREDGL